MILRQAWKGLIMRIWTTSALIAALALATPALAQSQDPTPQPNTTQAPSTKPAQQIRTVAVVDIKDLSPSIRSQVDAVVAKTSKDDLQRLRSSIDATPQASSALKAKGFSSAQVVAANVGNDGTLTLIINTTA